ncbi:hypothetical protein PFISCL1PPCAC_15760 [Pristionchus fissidentatus]|uniref:Cleavage/polyadenylation specificity factor A subunit N-terminal domain-containing protein n=1 Tax=Pristionchus fissidentatus TaxID=1538716 RepID=A0AAV5W1W5_9BILA|nr:hypothetical protein PFISCL1PPCAC_15760 [Pristionchus fissidentatus]
MNGDIQILPRRCLTSDKKKNLLVSATGPIVQVFKFDAKEYSFPISTIHCFDRQNVNVEFIQSITDTGHYLVAGDKFATVIHEGEITSGMSWIDPDRIHKFNSEIVDVFTVIESKCTDHLAFSLFILHKNRRLIRYSIRIHSKEKGGLSIKVTPIEEKILCDRMRFVSALSPSNFFVYYTDSVMSMHPPHIVTRVPCAFPPTATLLALSFHGESVAKISSHGEVQVLRNEKGKTPGNTLRLLEDAEMTNIWESHEATPICAVFTRLKGDCHAKESTGHSCGCMVVIGFEDGYISFNSMHGEIKKINLKSGPILSLLVNDQQVVYGTQSGSLGYLSIPIHSSDHPTNRLISLRGITNYCKPKRELIVSSCSFHLFSSPITAILVMADDIRIFILKGTNSSEWEKTIEWNREEFISGSITVFPLDLYTSKSPRLLVALATVNEVHLRVVHTDGSARFHNDRIPCSEFLVKKISSVSLPPPWMISLKGEEIDLRIIVFGDNRLVLTGVQFFQSGEMKRATQLYFGADPDGRTQMGTSISPLYVANRIGSVVEWVRDGKLESLSFTPTVPVKKKIDVMQHCKNYAHNKTNGLIVDASDIAIRATAAASMWDGDENSTRVTAVGTLCGNVVAFSLEEGLVDMNTVSADIEITAISVSHCLFIQTLSNGEEKKESFNLILAAAKDRSVTLILLRNEKMTILTRQKSSVDGAKGVYCIEGTTKKSVRVLLVGMNIQTLHFCLKPLYSQLESGKGIVIVSAGPIPIQLEMHKPQSRSDKSIKKTRRGKYGGKR